ncbi:hypothetical protein RB595_008075 [Gaeumannomyces hyphopodioides]
MSGQEPTFGFAILFEDIGADTLFIDKQRHLWPYYVQKVMTFQADTPLAHVLARFVVRTDGADATAAHIAGRSIAKAVYNSLKPEQQEEIWLRGKDQDPDDTGSIYFPYHNMETLSTLIISCRASGARLPRVVVLLFLVGTLEVLDAVHAACEGSCDIPKALEPGNIFVHQNNSSHGQHVSFYVGPGCSGWDLGRGREATAPNPRGHPRHWEVADLVSLTVELLDLPSPVPDAERVLRELKEGPNDDLVSGTLWHTIAWLRQLHVDFISQGDAASVQEVSYPRLENLTAIGRLLFDKERGTDPWKLYNVGPALSEDGSMGMAPRIFKTAAEAWAASEALGGRNTIACVSTSPLVT